jgi:hypothetical protein
MRRWLTSLIAISKAGLRRAAPLLLLTLWAALIAVYFNYKVKGFWLVTWTHDDLMNAYRAVATPYGQMLREVAIFWKPSPIYRPLGELFYRVIFDGSGWNPLPWRFAIFGLLLANALLLGHVARRLSGSVAAGLAAMALAAFHPHWIYLYLNTGTVFEILAYTFVWGGMALYLEAAEHGQQDKPWLLGLLALVYILGLNAKESTITLPAFLFLYEVIVKRRLPWRMAALLGAISLAFIGGRIYGPEGLSSVGQYVPSYQVATYLERFRNFLGHLLLWKDIPIYAALAVAVFPALLRTRQGLFVWSIFPVGILPLAFVAERGLDGVYIACAALPLFVALLIAAVPQENFRLGVAGCVLLGLWLWLPPINNHSWDRESKEIENFHSSLIALAPTMPRGVQIRFLTEPFNADSEWASTFITRLAYRDPSLLVIAPNNPHTKNISNGKDFAVFEWRSDRLVRIQ